MCLFVPQPTRSSALLCWEVPYKPSDAQPVVSVGAQNGHNKLSQVQQLPQFLMTHLHLMLCTCEGICLCRAHAVHVDDACNDAGVVVDDAEEVGHHGEMQTGRIPSTRPS